MGIITETDLFKLFLELLGARRPGVRLTMLLPDVKGTLATVTTAIAEQGGDIIALGTFLGEDPSNFLAAIKVADVPKATLIATLTPLALQMVHVREGWVSQTAKTGPEGRGGSLSFPDASEPVRNGDPRGQELSERIR